MTHFDYDIGIIGGGAAGLTVASGTAQLGAKTLLIEKEGALGGDCLHYGCVPSKTLIKSANVYHAIKHARVYGLPALEVPPVEFHQVADRIRSVVAKIQEHDSVERFCGLGAQVEFGAAHFTDEHTVDIEGRSYTAHKWVIATGSSPIVPPIDGLREIDYLTNREIFYMDRLPASMTILGGGPIGIEMAQAFNRFGCRVTVVDMSGQILGKEDKDMADAVMTVLENEGVSFLLNAKVVRVRQERSDRKAVVVETHGGEQTLVADSILVAIGRTANVGGLGLEDIGVDFDRVGIKVDNRMRTSQKHIYAAGDITGPPMCANKAMVQGWVAGLHAAGGKVKGYRPDSIIEAVYTDPQVAQVGLGEAAAAKRGTAVRVLKSAYGASLKGALSEERAGFVKLIADADSNRILGAGAVGSHAADVLAPLALGIELKATLEDCRGLFAAHPSLSELPFLAARSEHRR